MSTKNFTQDERRNKLRKTTAIVAIVIAVLSLIGAPLLPLVDDDASFTDIGTIITMVIILHLAVAFLVLGIVFLKKDSRPVAIGLLVLFIIYAIERVVMIAMAINFFAVMWLVLSIVQIIQLFQFLKIPPQGHSIQPGMPLPPSAQLSDDSMSPQETPPTPNH